MPGNVGGEVDVAEQVQTGAAVGGVAEVKDVGSTSS